MNPQYLIELLVTQEQPFYKKYGEHLVHITESLNSLKALPVTVESNSFNDGCVINLCNIALDYCEDLNERFIEHESYINSLNQNDFSNNPNEIEDEINFSIKVLESFITTIAVIEAVVVGLQKIIEVDLNKTSISNLMSNASDIATCFLIDIDDGLIKVTHDHKLLLTNRALNTASPAIKEVT